MLLTEILDQSAVVVPLAAKNKSEAIAELITALKSNGNLIDPDAALKAVMERESIRSTGIGQGFAIPHGKCSAVKELVMAVGRLQEPIDFGSIDGKPVEIVVLLVSPMDRTGPHIQALARISRLMKSQDVSANLKNAGSSQELYDHIISCDQSENTAS
jgi:fructose-specific phosphotransferase system IIA component